MMRATPGSSVALPRPRLLDRLARYENTPPLFYLLLTPVRVDDEVWVRWPSIAAGLAAVPVLYAAVRELLSARAGLLGALGLAVSPLASAFSDYARGFALSTLGGGDRAVGLRAARHRGPAPYPRALCIRPQAAPASARHGRRVVEVPISRHEHANSRGKREVHRAHPRLDTLVLISRRRHLPWRGLILRRRPRARSGGRQRRPPPRRR
jgi:hypothetical protein